MRNQIALHWVASIAFLLCGSSAIAQATDDSSADATADAVIQLDAAPESPPQIQLSPLQAAIRDEVARRLEEAKSTASNKRIAGIEAEYILSDYNPVWTDETGATAKANDMIEIMSKAEEDGLYPGDYQPDVLAEKLSASGPAAIADLEVLLSISAVTYAQHMNAGRLNPRQVNREIVIDPDHASSEVLLGNIRKTTSLQAYLRLLAPSTPRYERLRSALAVYRRIEQEGGWTVIPEGEVIKPGNTDDRVPLIRQRMLEAGTYAGDLPDEEAALVYDEALQQAVTTFQLRAGQSTDGVIGPATIGAMNVPVSDRVNTMVVNMERNRWMQNDFGRHHVLANLADQVVKVVRDGDTVHAEVIQVGAPYHRTPVFSDEMEYVEINPYWNVPVSIAVNEYLPKLRRNPSVLASQNIELLSNGKAISAHAVSWSNYGRGNFPFRLRQRPGNGNALGRIKFMFPNRFNVYMHDTPSKSKFEATQRYFSHGCLRLRDPLKMAEIILGPRGWDRDRIDSVVAGKKRTVVKLEETIPVHVVYITSFVNKDGSVHFREDVYGRDKILLAALEKVRRQN